MKKEKVQLLHPEGKKAPAIDKVKYDVLRTSFLSCLKVRKEAIFQELLADVEQDLKKKNIEIEGKLEWNLFWIILDLESRKELKRNKSISPIRYSLG